MVTSKQLCFVSLNCYLRFAIFLLLALPSYGSPVGRWQSSPPFTNPARSLIDQYRKYEINEIILSVFEDEGIPLSRGIPIEHSGIRFKADGYNKKWNMGFEFRASDTFYQEELPYWYMMGQHRLKGDFLKFRKLDSWLSLVQDDAVHAFSTDLAWSLYDELESQAVQTGNSSLYEEARKKYFDEVDKTELSPDEEQRLQLLPPAESPQFFVLSRGHPLLAIDPNDYTLSLAEKGEITLLGAIRSPKTDELKYQFIRRRTHKKAIRKLKEGTREYIVRARKQRQLLSSP